MSISHNRLSALPEIYYWSFSLVHNRRAPQLATSQLRLCQLEVGNTDSNNTNTHNTNNRLHRL